MKYLVCVFLAVCGGGRKLEQDGRVCWVHRPRDRPPSREERGAKYLKARQWPICFLQDRPCASISVSSARVDWRIESIAKISFSLIVAINSATANHVSNPLFLLSMTSPCWFFLDWEFWPSTEHYNCWVQRNTINCQAELGVGKSCACKQICIFGDLQIWACVGHSGPQQSS